MCAHTAWSDGGYRFRRGTASHKRDGDQCFQKLWRKLPPRYKKDTCIHTLATFGVTPAEPALRNHFCSHPSHYSLGNALRDFDHGYFDVRQSLPKSRGERVRYGLACEEVLIAQRRTWQHACGLYPAPWQHGMYCMFACHSFLMAVWR